ncbi:hypothetical protein [Amycolatopsis sp. 195334CR]|uniref:hypothetical protein n=1 Tax=Amycolatopsis sp. 195334CR TaxID=2814588 RepID=UPI001A8CA4AF|nr:hypothetical protein [Amycolatopsis sp. 195334CR]MBN6039985.1 hypothetical protein [Amycolatopsis sp. 195334CR]
MLQWVATGYGVLVAVLIAAAAGVALFVPDTSQREMGFKVLKLMLGTATGAGGTLALLVRVHEIGLL